MLGPTTLYCEGYPPSILSLSKIILATKPEKNENLRENLILRREYWTIALSSNENLYQADESLWIKILQKDWESD